MQESLKVGRRRECDQGEGIVKMRGIYLSAVPPSAQVIDPDSCWPTCEHQTNFDFSYSQTLK